MKWNCLLNTVSENISEAGQIAEDTSSVHPAFLVIVGVIVVGMVIMIIQNFVIKKEEYYK